MAAQRDAPTIEVEADGPRVTIKVIGEVDVDCAPTLGRMLHDVLAEEWTAAVLDLEGVAFLDSTGLSLLLQLSQQMRQNGAELTLRNVPPTIERLLEVTGTKASFGEAEK
jgi:anti-sigma B factor antagonist